MTDYLLVLQVVHIQIFRTIVRFFQSKHGPFILVGPRKIVRPPRRRIVSRHRHQIVIGLFLDKCDMMGGIVRKVFPVRAYGRTAGPGIGIVYQIGDAGSEVILINRV